MPELAEVPPGQYVMVAVTDTGGGMARQVGARSSRSSPPSRSARAPAWASAWSTASSSSRGGHVKIYSELGEGTTIKLYFPRRSGRVARLDRRRARGEPAGSAARHGEIILLVEDEVEVRKFAAEVLSEHG